MADAVQPVLISQRSRRLTSQKYSPSQPLSFLLPSGEVIKEMIITMKGKFTPTYASGSPVTHPLGMLDALVSRMQVITDGGKIRKSFNGVDVLRRQGKWLFGQDAAPYYKANSSTLGNTPTKGFAQIGTTAQDVSFVESVSICFENKLSSEWYRTLLNLKGKNASYLQIDCAPIERIQQLGGAVAITYTHDIEIEVMLVTAPHRVNDVFQTWRQTTKTFELTGAVNQRPYELDRGGRVQGFWLRIEKGAARDRINFDEAKNFRFQVMLNGTELVKEFSLLDVIHENGNKSKMPDLLPGCAYINFLDNSDFNSGLDTRTEAGVRSFDLVVTSDSSLSYSPNPVRLTIEQDDIVQLD